MNKKINVFIWIIAIVVILYILFVLFQFIWIGLMSGAINLNKWSNYKIANESFFLHDSPETDRESNEVKKGSLCKFRKVGGGSTMFYIKCKNGLYGSIDLFEINDYFINIK